MYVHNQDWESAQRVAEAHDPGTNPNAYKRFKVMGYKKFQRKRKNIRQNIRVFRDPHDI